MLRAQQCREGLYVLLKSAKVPKRSYPLQDTAVGLCLRKRKRVRVEPAFSGMTLSFGKIPRCRHCEYIYWLVHTIYHMISDLELLTP